MARIAQLLLAPLYLLLAGGCATLGQSKTAQEMVAAAAAPAQDLAVDALELQIASLPADPADLRTWCISAGLTADEADLVVSEAGGELVAALASLPRYIDGGAVGRLALSALVREPPTIVGPREAARFLLAWALEHQAVRSALPP